MEKNEIIGFKIKDKTGKVWLILNDDKPKNAVGTAMPDNRKSMRPHFKHWWTKEETEFLKKTYPEFGIIKIIGKYPKFTKWAIRKRALKLGIKKVKVIKNESTPTGD